MIEGTMKLDNVPMTVQQVTLTPLGENRHDAVISLRMTVTPDLLGALPEGPWVRGDLDVTAAQIQKWQSEQQKLLDAWEAKIREIDALWEISRREAEALGQEPPEKQHKPDFSGPPAPTSPVTSRVVASLKKCTLSGDVFVGEEGTEPASDALCVPLTGDIAGGVKIVSTQDLPMMILKVRARLSSSGAQELSDISGKDNLFFWGTLSPSDPK